MIDLDNFYARQPEEELPVIEGVQVQQILQDKIDRMIKRIQRPPIEWGDAFLTQISRFFSIEGRNQSPLEDIHRKMSLVNNGHLQEIGMGLMEQYGLREGHNYAGYKTPNEIADEKPIVLKNGKVEETTTYPSVSIPGLAFRRTLTMMPDSNKITKINWNLVDESGFKDSID
jgi:hypothetical protein